MALPSYEKPVESDEYKPHMGSESGTGNPPGKHSESYLNLPKEEEKHFVSLPDYRGNMSVGIVETAQEVGNQPKSTSTETLEKRANKTQSW